SNPITGIADCCARVATGQAVTKPTVALMKSRRRIAAPRLRSTPIEANYTRDLRPAEWGSGVSLHGSNLGSLMSALGHKRTSEDVRVMSALPPKADISQPHQNVYFGPEGTSITAYRLRAIRLGK